MRKAMMTLFLAVVLAPAAMAADFKVVVHPDVPVSTLTKTAVSDLFMKKTPKWQNGLPVVAVDQSAEAGVRRSFSTAIHRKSTPAIVSFWRQQIFAGRDVPPVEKASDGEVVALVARTPGAIGYVSSDAPTTGLKVIELR